MITEFGVGNFQAFGELQRVPLKPITLIFGPNSAGKSALIRSLLVAKHAILNERLDGTAAADPGHPGEFRSYVRNAKSNEGILIEFKMLPDDHPAEKAGTAIRLQWRAGERGETQTKSMALHERGVLWAEFDAGWRGPLILKEYGAEIKAAISSASPDGKGLKLRDDTIEGRCALRAESALPGRKLDQLANPQGRLDESNDAICVLNDILEDGRQGGFDLSEEMETKFTSIISRLTNASQALQSKINSRMTQVAEQLDSFWAAWEHHGPLRPVPREISKKDQTDQGLKSWWQLASDPDLLERINAWLQSPAFSSKHFIEFDRMFVASRFSELVDSLRGKLTENQVIKSAYLAKLDLDNSIAESFMHDHEGPWDEFNDTTDPDKRREALECAKDCIAGSAKSYGVSFVDQLIDEGDINGLLEFFMLGVNSLRNEYSEMLEKPWEKFDLAEVRFVIDGTKTRVSPSNLGIGFSQMIPLVVSAFASENRLIAIEQPELHIHPALQTELADLFIQSASERKNRFLIETHSEHLILRILRRIRETTRGTLPEGKSPIRREDVAVLYVQPSPEGSKVIEMRIDDQGRLVDNWPNGFFEERLDELF